MKKRQKFTVSERSLLKCTDLGREETTLQLKIRKKISSNPLIQKNFKFLQAYNSLFRKPSQHFGDADSYFRKSLRNNGAFDIVRELNLEPNLVQSSTESDCFFASQDHIHGHSHEQGRYYLDRRSNLNLDLPLESSYSLKELYTTKNRDLDKSDTETELFYSPTENLYHFEKPNEDFDEQADKSSEVEQDLTEESEDFKSNQDLIEEKVQESELEDTKSENSSSASEEEEPDETAADDFNSNRPEASKVVLEVIEEEKFRMGEEGPEDFPTDDGEAEEIMAPIPDEAFTTTDGEATEATEATEGGDTDAGNDQMDEVEQMIQRASRELQEVANENRQLLEKLNEEEEEPEIRVEFKPPKLRAKETTDDAGDGSVFKFDPKVDAAIIRELDEAEKQAKITANVILKIKERVQELLKIEKMTEAQAKELEEKNLELVKHMQDFENTTKRIQSLIAQSNLFEDMIAIQPPLQQKHHEDILPKVLFCGMTENNMPKLIVCDDNRREKCSKKKRKSAAGDLRPSGDSPVSTRSCSPSRDVGSQRPGVNFQANYAYTQVPPQQGFPPQEGFFDNKDQTIQCLQRQLCQLQNQMMSSTPNTSNTPNIQGQYSKTCPNPSCPKNSRSSSPKRKGRGGCGPGSGQLCPTDVMNRLKDYAETTQQLEQQLCEMECEVKSVQQEIAAVQKEREHLEHHRKQLCGFPPCFRPPCGPPPCSPPPCPPKPGIEQALMELREQYNRLQDDFKAKITEVAGLRADNTKLKEGIEAAMEAQVKAENKLKECENRIKQLLGESSGKGGEIITKERVMELEQQVRTYKEMHRQAQDELDELRACVEDLQTQVNDYRNKYLEAEQTVEEHRRQIELMRLESNRVSEQVNLEIQKVKNQFQEKLQELAPLPDILKATQVKLQEAQQMHLLAERNNEALARELQMYKDKLQAIQNELQGSQSNLELGENELTQLKQKVKDLEERVTQLSDEKQDMIIEMEKLREKAETNERLASERAHEITQLNTQLESVREDCARQVAKTKDRCNIVRKSMQNQITDLERQLAQTKAIAKAAERDRDDVRQKMQAQINNLNSNFEDALMRIRNLQGHVNFLKNTYGPIFPCEGPVKESKPDPCSCGVDY